MIDLSTIKVREPAVLIRDPGGTPSYFWSKKEITIKPEVEYFEVPMAAQSHQDKRIKSLYYVIENDFVGEWEHTAYLFPHLSAALGSSVLGTTDVAYRLVGLISGDKWDFPRGGIIERPKLTVRVGDTLLGKAKFAFCCASDKNPGEAGAFYTFTAASTPPNFSTYAPSGVLTLAPAITYGTLLSAASPENGVEFDFKWTTKPVLDNTLIRDWTVSAQEFTAKCKPYALDFDDIVTACGYDLAMGARLPVATFSAAYSGFYAALRGATCEQASFKFAGDADFIEGLVFRASQTYSANVQVAPGYVGTSAPS